jgi:hypothetical protein
MVRKTFERAVMVVVTAVTLAVASQVTPAQAAVVSAPATSPAAIVPTVTPSSTPLADAFGSAPTTILQNLLCPIVTGLAGATSSIPGVGAIVDILPKVVCAISVVGYVIKSTYLPPTGPPIIKYTRALAGVPTLLNVDGQGLLPDFIATLGVNLTLNGINFNVARATFPASGRVSIEAIAIDPAAPSTFVGFGEDGTANGTANNWTAKVSVLGIGADTVDLGLDISTSGQPSSLAVLGELFSGPPDSPDHVYRGNASFSPVPAKFSPELRLSQGRQEVLVTSPPTTLTAKVTILSPNREQTVDLTADQLPSMIDIVHNAGTSDTTTYDASGSIAKLTGAYHDKVGGNIVTAAALDVWGVPTHLSFDQTGDTTSLSAGSGQIDRVQARYAQGSDVDALDPGTGPFARYHRTTASAFTADVQVSALKSLSFKQSAPYGGELVFGTAPGSFPLTAQDDVSGLHVDGSLSGLPADTTVSLDPDNGVVTFDGHGTGINQIYLKATRPTPFFTRATRLEATLQNLPALETVNVLQSNGGVTATASAPLGTITLLASDGSGAPSITGSAASYEDTSSLYRAFVRLTGLTSVSFQPSPLTGDIQTANPQFLTVHGNVSGISFDGTIDQLPAHLTFSMQPGSGGSNVIDYDSHGQTINTITASGNGLTALPGMPNFEAKIVDLPSHLTVTIPAAGGNVTFDAYGAHITRVYAQAYGSSKITVDPTRQLLSYSDGQHIAANLLGVGSAEFGTSSSPIHIKYDIASIPLDYSVTTSDVDLSGTIKNPQPATITITPHDPAVGGENGITAQYNVDPANHSNADGSIDSISLAGTIGSSYLNATIANIPANLNICIQTAKGTLCRPTWTPGVEGETLEPPDFAMHFFPTDFSGHVPATPVVVNGTVCPDQSNSNNCLDLGENQKRIVINDLSFKTVEAAFSSHDEGCDVACGAVWAEASTYGPGSPSEGDHITGRVRYFDGDGDIFPDPKVDLNLAAPDSFLALNRLFFWLHYDAISTTPLEYATSGTLTCGTDPHLIIGINNFPDPDLLSGIFGIC